MLKQVSRAARSAKRRSGPPKPNGVILWRGSSLLDGAPIVAIAVGLATGSTNRKTGAMLQTYILRSDIDPVAAVRTGADASICGNCRHRGELVVAMGGVRNVRRTCYVQVAQGPLGVYKAFKRGLYPAAREYSDALRASYGVPPGTDRASLEIIGRGKQVRIGTYGDPAAAPLTVWQWLIESAAGHTAYTHQWRRAEPGLQSICMASVDSFAEALEAQAAGWRTFRVGMPCDDGMHLAREVLCPASKEAGRKLTCAQCLACCGNDGRRGSIYIPAHGGTAIMSAVRQLAGIPVVTSHAST